ncbi:MAG: hypothetical protein QM731_24765 [Chitinophagaceae bacterium]
MKIRKTFNSRWLLVAVSSVLFTSCYKMQTDYNRDPAPLDPHINKSAWQFLKDRSYANNTDTVFRVMYDAIVYSEMDTLEYAKSNKTFIFMNNTSAKAVWTNIKTSANVAGKKWSDYPKEAVRNYLKYLILDGVYDHYTIPALNDLSVATLAPKGYFGGATSPVGFVIPSYSPNPDSQMKIQVVNSSPSNTSDYPVQLNDVLNVATSSILATNGTVHVIAGYLTTNIPQ